MLSYEKGPWYLFQNVRGLFGIEHDDAGEPSQWPDTMLANLLVCVWCLSVWVGAFVTGLYLINPALIRTIMIPFALSTGAVVIERLAR
jgi:hypothetical protein